MLKGLAGKVQTYAVYIIVAVIVITILLAGTLPSIEVITNWEEFVRVAKKNPKAKDQLAVAEGHIKELKERKKALDLQ